MEEENKLIEERREKLKALRAQGKPSTPVQAAWELRLSHFTGDVAQLEVWQDWKYDTKINAVFGRMT